MTFAEAFRACEEIAKRANDDIQLETKATSYRGNDGKTRTVELTWSLFSNRTRKVIEAPDARTLVSLYRHSMPRVRPSMAERLADVGNVQPVAS